MLCLQSKYCITLSKKFSKNQKWWLMHHTLLFPIFSIFTMKDCMVLQYPQSIYVCCWYIPKKPCLFPFRYFLRYPHYDQIAVYLADSGPGWHWIFSNLHIYILWNNGMNFWPPFRTVMLFAKNTDYLCIFRRIGARNTQNYWKNCSSIRRCSRISCVFTWNQYFM